MKPRRTSLADRFADQARRCREAGSPLTAALLTGAATEVGRRGPVRDLLGPLEQDPPGSVPSLRFAGALHRLVLERRAPALALHYPSVGGTAPAESVWPVAREVVTGVPDLAELLEGPVQTNETGRSAVLLGGLRAAVSEHELPVRLLELGASAGLNLAVDRFAYEVGDRVLGDPASPVRLVQPWQGAPAEADVVIASRGGCDPYALDPTSQEGRLTLSSYVWADDLTRFRRLRAALSVAALHPTPVERLPASTFLERELSEPAPGVLTVVWHSVVWQYLSEAERAATMRTLREAGERATATAPLAHLMLEPERSAAGGFTFGVHLQTWPGGPRRRIATAQGHGPPVVWAPVR